ncbi:Peptidoglycan/xylan/chitin deacetylase, PgdA/CDA1 family [Actinokineospora iranica]|uniref:Peptidoglycan/xylan/chitin deacetylase, PgdA/CDA1 family n=1 Tax=Actinokineospora iranica TaxID=1271860 RepID=A0A1G6XC12_9PSEU|nr:Peptidoglycan/xylan/chitin deacetylase, PgdA/CDA1 family [Actinokineospora iranica]
MLAAAALVALTAACGGSGSGDPPANQPAANASAAEPVASVPTSPPPPEPQAVAANELGQVPVLMYHRIIAQPTSVFDRTPADFRAELERLANEGYVTVTVAQYATGDIDIPAGKHPVVLTFDDGDPTQLTLTPEGEPAPDTAAAILREVAAAHPEFRGVGSFYVNGDPFGDPGGRKTLLWLRKNGMEIGNHTLSHSNLRTISAEAAQRAIVQGDQAIRAAGGAPLSISLPFGIHPRDPALALNGSADGVEYHYRAALLVGANPARSPYSAEFDPLRIPRIRSQGPTGTEAEFGSTVWLDKIAAAPAQRYTSDGVADRISYPEASGATVAETYRARANAY